MGQVRDRLWRTWQALLERAPGDGPEDEPGEVVDYRALELVLRVGELLLAGGEATERVNEAMLSLAVAFELPRCEVQVTFTSLLVSTHPRSDTTAPVTVARATRRRVPAYWRLIELHRLVQEASVGLLDLDQAFARFDEIKRGRAPYPKWLMVVVFGLIAASASVLAGGGPLVAGTAFFSTLLGDRTAAALARRGVAEFFQLTLAAAIGAGSAALVVAAGAGQGASSAIVTGTIVALLPGRPLVASILDGITGDLVSSAARLLEVFFIVTAIVAGLGATVYLAVRLGVNLDVANLPSAPVSLRPVTAAAAGVVSLVFAVSLAVPRDALLPATIGGIMIWCLDVVLRGLDVVPVLAAAISAIAMGVAANMHARRRHAPALPYVVPAIAPLLPGTMLYRGMIELNSGDPSQGVLSLIGALSVALALAAGVSLGGELVRAFQRVGLGGAGRWARPAARRTRGY